MFYSRVQSGTCESASSKTWPLSSALFLWVILIAFFFLLFCRSFIWGWSSMLQPWHSMQVRVADFTTGCITQHFTPGRFNYFSKRARFGKKSQVVGRLYLLCLTCKAWKFKCVQTICLFIFSQLSLLVFTIEKERNVMYPKPF